MSGAYEVLQDSRRFKGAEMERVKKKWRKEGRRLLRDEQGREKKRKDGEVTSSSRGKMREMIAGRGQGLKME